MRRWVYLALLFYIFFPYDLVPDFLLGAGWVDDLLALGLLVYLFYVKRQGRGQKRTHEAEEKREGHFGEAGSSGRTREEPEKAAAWDPYRVLSVNQTASADEIKAAYRRLAGKYHPDKVSHLGEEFKVLAEEKFKEIQRAYDELIVKSRAQ